MLTTHYLEEAVAIADRVVVIDHGLVIADDSADRLKSGLGDLVCLELADEGQAAIAAERAAAVLPSGASVELEGRRVRARAARASQAAAGLVTDLVGLGVDVTRMQIAGATLDDVFLSLTVRSLRETDQNQTDDRTEGRTDIEGVAA